MTEAFKKKNKNRKPKSKTFVWYKTKGKNNKFPSLKFELQRFDPFTGYVGNLDLNLDATTTSSESLVLSQPNSTKLNAYAQILRQVIYLLKPQITSNLNYEWLDPSRGT